jgi:hypothetical protein
VVLVVLVPIGAGKFPPLVSFIAEHAGGLVVGTPKVRVHVPVTGRVGSGVPSVTLPAASELVPTRAAPTPQSDPRVGVPANEAFDQHKTAAPASKAVSALLVLDKYRRMITFPAPALL